MCELITQQNHNTRELESLPPFPDTRNTEHS